MKYEYPKSIQEAAFLLDKIKSGWQKNISISVLDMHSYEKCILGQVFGSFPKAVDELFGLSTYDTCSDKIFGYTADTNEWIREINMRNDIKDFKWALEQIKAGKKVRQKRWNVEIYVYCTGVHDTIRYNKGCSITLGHIYDGLNATDWELFEPEIMVRTGSRVRDKSDNAEYIVSKTDVSYHCLIGLHDGNRWIEPINIESPMKLSLLVTDKDQYKTFEIIKY